jgi:hypothetical protein
MGGIAACRQAAHEEPERHDEQPGSDQNQEYRALRLPLAPEGSGTTLSGARARGLDHEPANGLRFKGECRSWRRGCLSATGIKRAREFSCP